MFISKYFFYFLEFQTAFLPHIPDIHINFINLILYKVTIELVLVAIQLSAIP